MGFLSVVLPQLKIYSRYVVVVVVVVATLNGTPVATTTVNKTAINHK